MVTSKDQELLLEEAQKLDKKYSLFITLNTRVKVCPIAIKDNICTKSIETTAGSLILKNYKPPFDATVVKKLKQAGYGILGKTCMDEFGFGSFSTNTFRIPKNPHDLARVCGGSSGGSAAFIAASRYAKFALGTSTGGSISCPAAFCGVVGLTPTYGLVSRYGLISYANSMDKVGILAKTSEDAFEALRIIAGPDELDPTSTNSHFEKIKCKRKYKIAILGGLFEKCDKKIANKVYDFLNSNFAIQEVKLPIIEQYALETYYILAMAEASTNLAKYCGLRYGAAENLAGDFNSYFALVRSKYFGFEAKRRVVLGTFIRTKGYKDKFYLKAAKLRSKIIREYQQVFKEFDALATPTMPCIAPKFKDVKRMSPVEAYAMDILTVPPNLAGLPHLSLPIGKVRNMPIAVQFITNYFQDILLKEFAKC